jgi:hypothetical protein
MDSSRKRNLVRVESGTTMVRRPLSIAATAEVPVHWKLSSVDIDIGYSITGSLAESVSLRLLRSSRYA